VVRCFERAERTAYKDAHKDSRAQNCCKHLQTLLRLMSCFMDARKRRSCFDDGAMGMSAQMPFDMHWLLFAHAVIACMCACSKKAYQGIYAQSSFSPCKVPSQGCLEGEEGEGREEEVEGATECGQWRSQTTAIAEFIKLES